MQANKIYQLNRQHPDLLFIDSNVEGLNYVVDHRRKEVVIIGHKGMVMLTRTQLDALIDEIGEVERVFITRND